MEISVRKIKMLSSLYQNKFDYQICNYEEFIVQYNKDLVVCVSIQE